MDSTTVSVSACVDLVFAAVGPSVAVQHGYSLYGAISRIVPAAHASKEIGIFPIRGSSAGNGTLRLTRYSAVRLRMPATQLPTFLPLAGETLELDGHRLRLGVPSVAGLVPAPTLRCDLVLIKLARPKDTTEPRLITPESFLTAAAKQLAALNILATPHLQRTLTGPHAGQARRRVLKVRSQTHAGYGMVIEGLTADESIRLQEHGLGGRRLMGCGLFLPAEKEARRVG